MAAELLRDPEPRALSLAAAWTHTLYWNGTDGMPGRQNKLQYVSEMLSGLGTISHVRLRLRAVSGHRGSSSSSLFIYSPLSAEVTESRVCSSWNSISMVCIKNPTQIESRTDRGGSAMSSSGYTEKKAASNCLAYEMQQPPDEALTFFFKLLFLCSDYFVTQNNRWQLNHE